MAWSSVSSSSLSGEWEEVGEEVGESEVSEREWVEVR